MLRAWSAFIVLAVLSTPQLTLAQAPAGEYVLQQRAVVLSMPHLNGSYTSCLGFRLFRDGMPSDVDLIATAGHCVRELGQNSMIVVTSLTGKRALGRYRLYWANVDVAFVLSKPSFGWLDQVNDTWSYQAPARGVPVLAMIRVGGGKPTVASGNILGQSGYLTRLLLPVANGTSGGGVVDLRGALVGIVSTGNPSAMTGASSQAEYVTNVVAMSMITRLLNQENDRILEESNKLSSHH